MAAAIPRRSRECARIGADFGYDEINLNVGCPSDRVQEGRFGACLMAEPALVGDCVAAMKAAVAIPVTVKCRIGIDDQDPEEALDDFDRARSSAAGADALIVHARKAWLSGLSPRENRDIPPLDYDIVFRLKAAHPKLPIVLNGGIATRRGRARASAKARRRDDGPRGLSGAVAAAGGRSAAVRRGRAVRLAEGRGAGAACPTSSASCRAACGCIRSRAICTACSSGAGRARLPPASGDGGGQARRMRRGSGRGAGAGGGQARRSGANRRGVTLRPGRIPGNVMLLGCRSARSRCSSPPWWSRGVATGILAGLFGIGGGAIIVPVLYEIFRILGVPEEVRMQLCVGTSMAIIIPTTIRSYLRASRQGRGADRRDAALGGAGGGRRRRRLGDRLFRAERGVQDRVHGDRDASIAHQAAVRPRQLADRRRLSRPRRR